MIQLPVGKSKTEGEVPDIVANAMPNYDSRYQKKMPDVERQPTNKKCDHQGHNHPCHLTSCSFGLDEKGYVMLVEQKTFPLQYTNTSDLK